MYPVDGWSQGKMKDSKRLPFSEKPPKVPPDSKKSPAAPQKTHNKQMQKRGKK